MRGGVARLAGTCQRRPSNCADIACDPGRRRPRSRSDHRNTTNKGDPHVAHMDPLTERNNHFATTDACDGTSIVAKYPVYVITCPDPFCRGFVDLIGADDSALA